MALKSLRAGGLFAILGFAAFSGCGDKSKDTSVPATQQATDAAEAEASAKFMEEQMKKGKK